jgi:hypothetical protein
MTRHFNAFRSMQVGNQSVYMGLGNKIGTPIVFSKSALARAITLEQEKQY